MEDKILDDDDIIDLTDLLEEGQPPRDKESIEGSTESRPSANEPDSFDLGKEISMEYDVSVEEIESSGDELDIDAALSSSEENALTRDEIGDEDIITLEDTGESLELELTDDSPAAVKETDFSADTEPVFSQEISDTPQTFDEQEFRGELEMDTPQGGTESVEPEEVTFDMEENAGGESVQEPDVERTEDFGGIEAPAGEEAPQYTGVDDVIADFKKEIPAMIEGIVRPFMAELVKEIMSASREQLPGIVEKIVREEIDKLKKLNV